MNFKLKFNRNSILTAIFYIAIFLLIVAYSFKNNAVDYDLWARLIMGNYVFHKGFPMYSDVVSYTPTHVWYDPEWLSSAFIYFIRVKFGIIGLTFLKAILFYLCMFFASLAIKDKVRNKVFAYNIGFYLILLFISFQASLINFSVRCQLVTFVFMAIWIYLLEKIRNNQNKLLVLLPFIMLIWLNSHGGCIAGVGILLLYGIGEFLNKKPFKKYFITLFFVCLVFLINPWGIDYIKFIVDSSYLDRSWISEWQSPFSRPLMFNFFYFVMLVSIIFCYGYKLYFKKINYQNLDKTKLIVLFVVAILSSKYIKHSGLFIVIYAIFMYEDFYFVYNDLMEKLRKYLQIDIIAARYLSYLKEIIIYFIIFAYSLFVFVTVPFNSSHYASILINYPVQPLRFLEMNGIKGRLFSGFYYGSFISYKYYPDIKIYMDGRQEQVYSSQLFDEAMFFLANLGDTPTKAITRYKPDIILVENSWRCNKTLVKNSDFKKVYQDDKYSVYLRKNVQKFSYSYPDLNFDNYFNKLFDTVFDYSRVKNK